MGLAVNTILFATAAGLYQPGASIAIPIPPSEMTNCAAAVAGLLNNVRIPAMLLAGVGKDGFLPLRVAEPLEPKECRRCGGTHSGITSPNLKLGSKIAFSNSDGVGLSDLLMDVGKVGFPPVRVAEPLEQKECRRCGGTHSGIIMPNLKLGSKIAFDFLLNTGPGHPHSSPY